MLRWRQRGKGFSPQHRVILRCCGNYEVPVLIHAFTCYLNQRPLVAKPDAAVT